METVRVALAGNPNTGKTTIFNALTGSRQYIGNWPGVTVEKVEGSYEKDGRLYQVVDLPGTYDLCT
ncbi:MAG TPA: FeoB small GTPase domain-containing protein, partial [bacterium]|nr:FeoB small GTPase domain-containing protein [bacterium]